MKHTVERADRPWRTTASIQQVIGNKNKKEKNGYRSRWGYIYGIKQFVWTENGTVK